VSRPRFKEQRMDLSRNDNHIILKSAVYLIKGTEERMRKKVGMLAVNREKLEVIKTLNLRQKKGMANRMKLVMLNKGDFKKETSLMSCITCFLLFIFFHIF
jgi:hypothetical protein